MEAMAARLMPLMRLIKKVPPTTMAPVDPALTKASTSPWASKVKARPREESRCSCNRVVGSSQMPMTSLVSEKCKPVRGMLCSTAVFFSTDSSPVITTSTPYSATAKAAPSNIARGA